MLWPICLAPRRARRRPSASSWRRCAGSRTGCGSGCPGASGTGASTARAAARRRSSARRCAGPGISSRRACRNVEASGPSGSPARGFSCTCRAGSSSCCPCARPARRPRRSRKRVPAPVDHRPAQRERFGRARAGVELQAEVPRDLLVVVLARPAMIASASSRSNGSGSGDWCSKESMPGRGVGEHHAVGDRELDGLAQHAHLVVAGLAGPVRLAGQRREDVAAHQRARRARAPSFAFHQSRATR
jgi:hypothetical protein